MHGPKTIATGAAGVRRGGHLLAAAAGFITVTTHTEAQTHERALMLSLCPHLTRWAHKNKIAMRGGAARHKRHYTLYLIIRYKIYKRSHGCALETPKQKWPERSPAPSRQPLFFTSLISLDKQAEWQIQKDEESKGLRCCLLINCYTYRLIM
jgi:hypothetical protein